MSRSRVIDCAIWEETPSVKGPIILLFFYLKTPMAPRLTLTSRPQGSLVSIWCFCPHVTIISLLSHPIIITSYSFWLGLLWCFLHLHLIDYVSERGGQGGDVFQPRRQLYVGVREDTRVVGRYEELPEFPGSDSDNRAHPGVLQYRTGIGQYCISTSEYCLIFKKTSDHI